MRAGLIPSRALQERRIVHERNELNGDTANLTSDKAEGTIFPLIYCNIRSVVEFQRW